MKIGEVTPDKEAHVSLLIRGSDGKAQQISAVLDTGYTEYLTLSTEIISTLGLSYQYSVPMFLADGQSIRVRVFDAEIIWFGQERSIPVQEMDGDSLLGFSLLYGMRLLLDAIDGGDVVIEELV